MNEQRVNGEFNEIGEIELRRLERCKKCSKVEETDNFMGLGITAIICPLHGFECSEVVQCLYVSDNTKYE